VGVLARITGGSGVREEKSKIKDQNAKIQSKTQKL
jgi:hypothetical protein